MQLVPELRRSCIVARILRCANGLLMLVARVFILACTACSAHGRSAVAVLLPLKGLTPCLIKRRAASLTLTCY